MSVVGGPQLPLDVLGGLVTDISPETLPPGVSPACSDVAFIAGVPGTVQTRPGISAVYVFDDLGFPAPRLTYLRTFTDLQLNNRGLYFDDNGILWQEYPQGTFVPIPTHEMLSDYAKSDTAFGREFMAFSDGRFGVDIPMQWDGQFFDRVSQSGPGLAPTITQTSVTVYTISTAVRLGNLSTITVTAPHTLVVGETVAIAGVTDSTFDDATALITAVPSSVSFQYQQIAADSTSSSGTATLAPQISAGVHGFSVCFVTRQGYITMPAVPVYVNCSAGNLLEASNIPIGPSNVVARLLIATAANVQNFFYSAANVEGASSMLIPDNTTTTWTFDFSDTGPYRAIPRTLTLTASSWRSAPARFSMATAWPIGVRGITCKISSTWISTEASPVHCPSAGLWTQRMARAVHRSPIRRKRIGASATK